MRRPDRSPPPDGGFTLIEVVAALAILAVVLGMAYRILGDGLGGVRRAEDRAAALAVAEARLAALGVEEPLVPGERTGVTAGHAWRIIVVPRRDPPFDGLEGRGLAALRIDVTVGDPSGGDVHMTTTRLARVR